MPKNKTIAVVGATERQGAEIAKRFSHIPCRLMLISNKPQELIELSNAIQQNKTVAEIETIECTKDGCWEADIIVLAVPESEAAHSAELMKNVVTQKIVIVLANTVCERILPYSKVVYVSQITGDTITFRCEDKTVNEEICTIFNQAGYKCKISGTNRSEKNLNH